MTTFRLATTSRLYNLLLKQGRLCYLVEFGVRANFLGRWRVPDAPLNRKLLDMLLARRKCGVICVPLPLDRLWFPIAACVTEAEASDVVAPGPAPRPVEAIHHRLRRGAGSCRRRARPTLGAAEGTGSRDGRDRHVTGRA